jgi:hypothetical protein
MQGLYASNWLDRGVTSVEPGAGALALAQDWLALQQQRIVSVRRAEVSTHRLRRFVPVRVLARQITNFDHHQHRADCNRHHPFLPATSTTLPETAFHFNRCLLSVIMS